MRVQLLGTGGAEAVPALFCGCETCRRARAAGGKNVRSRSTALIGEDLKIDLGPDIFYHVFRFGLDMSKLRWLFITHSHDDHFLANQLVYLSPGFADDRPAPPLRLCGSETVLAGVRDWLKNPRMPLEGVALRPFEPIECGSARVTPFPVEHIRGEACFNFVIESGGASALYGCDTRPYSDELLERLAAWRFDLLILECTKGTLTDKDWPHLGLQDVLRIRSRMSDLGAAHGETRTVVTHLAHGIGMLHEEFEAVAGREGVETGYDGAVYEV